MSPRAAKRATKPNPRADRIHADNASKITSASKQHLSLKDIQPLTATQERVFDSYDDGKMLFLSGWPGTGKSFLSIFLALSDIMDRSSVYEKLYIVRTAEPSKNVGFLPGSLQEKTEVYEAPYAGIFSELFGRDDSYKLMKTGGSVEFLTTSYIRGITLDNCIIVVDETQNLEANESLAIMTRLGPNSKIIFCGDYAQSDLKNNYKGSAKKEDFLRFKKVIEQMRSFDLIEFEVDDIVRSGIVKEFVIAATEQGFM